MTEKINIDKIFDQAMNQPKIKFADFKRDIDNLRDFDEIKNYCKKKILLILLWQSLLMKNTKKAT